jgi:hypothetical protein
VSVEERRKALARILGEAIRAALEAKRVVDEVREEVVRSVEEATGIPLTPEGAMIRRLYSFSFPRQPSREELERLIARYMGLEEGEDVVSYLKNLGGRDSRPIRAGGQRDTGGADEPG